MVLQDKGPVFPNLLSKGEVSSTKTQFQSSNLLHKKVDVHLCVVHDETMRVSDPL